MTAGLWAAALAALAASALAGLRWLRVAQREHYLAGSATRFGMRWWGGTGFNRLLWAVAALGVVAALSAPPAAVVTGAVVAAGPVGLGLRGRTSPLDWTPRLRRLAGTWAGLQLLVLAAAVYLGATGTRAGAGAALAGLAAMVVPALVDVACAVAAPLERRMVAPFVRSAAGRLARVKPVVVAITGSYGKTTTKGYVAHLVGTARSVVASPASYNNRAGLARAVNEGLADGTEVFVAEMGTYGPGEIAELCSWLAPAVAVITAVGPVHLERFGSEARILAAKSEILAGASAAVLNVDDARLAALADGLIQEGRTVWRCSKCDPAADVFVGPDPTAAPDGRAVPGGATVVMVRGQALVGGEAMAGLGPAAGAALTNVACAVAVALQLGVPAGEVARALPTLPVAANRLSAGTGAGGFTILDDTYNANPAGAARALEALAAAGPPGEGQPGGARSGGGRRVLVTPGMVELGRIQGQENRALGALALGTVTDLVVVGRTNRKALLEGAGMDARAAGVAVGDSGVRRLVDLGAGPGPAGGQDGGARPAVLVADTREQAVAWVREQLGPGDVVLYENDLPDHYP